MAYVLGTGLVKECGVFHLLVPLLEIPRTPRDECTNVLSFVLPPYLWTSVTMETAKVATPPLRLSTRGDQRDTKRAARKGRKRRKGKGRDKTPVKYRKYTEFVAAGAVSNRPQSNTVVEARGYAVRGVKAFARQIERRAAPFHEAVLDSFAKRGWRRNGEVERARQIFDMRLLVLWVALACGVHIAARMQRQGLAFVEMFLQWFRRRAVRLLLGQRSTGLWRLLLLFTEVLPSGAR